MFGSSQWMYSSGAASFYDHQIDGSLRFAAADAAQIYRTPSSAGNRRKWTWSGWLKRGAFSGTPHDEQYIFSVATGTGDSNHFYFKTDGSGARFKVSGYSTNWRESTARYRDPSSWYHVVLVVDTDNGTSQNRIRIYVNGEEITDWAINNHPSGDLAVNSTNRHDIGQHPPGYNRPFDGYMAEINFVDGQALTPSSFGETKSGVWIPKAYAGSYGTNGFHLEFAGNANDSSGNGNNWTASNISSHDYVSDSPTNNFATFNPLVKTNEDYVGTFVGKQGNLRAEGYTSQDMNAQASFAADSGKWYSEIYINNRGSDDHRNGVGIGTHMQKRSRTYGVLYQANGQKCVDDIRTSYGATWTTGDIIGIALNADSNQVTFYKNGSSQGTISFSRQQNVVTPFSAYSTNSSSYLQCTVNAGQDGTFAGATTSGGNSDANGYGDFKYSVPSGYLALCTANLTVAEGVDPALDASPKDHFTPYIYTGNGSSSRAITGIGFAPDMVWTKARSSAKDHSIHDKVRGVNKQLYPHSQGNEESNSGWLSAFGSDGYTIGLGGGGQHMNSNGVTYVSWNWKANGSGSSNGSGSITSTVSANTDLGLSIVGWTGNGSSATIGHGLSEKPQLIFLKNRTDSEKGEVMYDNTIPTYSMLLFAGTDGQSGGRLSNYFTSVSATTFGVGGYNRSNGSGDAMIAYCFHSVEGCTSVGKYVGNGSTDGPFIYTGIRPSFVLIKCTSETRPWAVFDTERDTYNVAKKVLSPDSTRAEFNNEALDIDILSNGFKCRETASETNGSGKSYIYMAFAENPFKYANAR